MPRPSRKQDFLDSAVAVVAREGFSNASLQALCDAADVTKGAFFHHFPSKEAFATELLEHFSASVDEALAAADFDALPTAKEHLDAYLGLLERMYGRDQRFRSGCLFAILVYEHADERSPIRRMCARGLQRWIDGATEQFRRIIAKSRNKPRVSARELAEHLLVVIEGGLVLGRATSATRAMQRAIGQFATYARAVLAIDGPP
jgi:TetR/AcrR family transcriptional repressor of nem operon